QVRPSPDGNTTSSIPTIVALAQGRASTGHATAASGTPPHSRYHGWTTGALTTTAKSPLPAAYAAPVRGARHAHHATAQAPPANPAPRARVTASSVVPHPSACVAAPHTRPASVLNDSAVKTLSDSPAVCSHPHPRPHSATPANSPA